MAEQTHSWKFFRAGGFAQVLLEGSADLIALPQLDQKLWSALSCPVQGVEFDRRTLELLDTDGDGHIRAPELLAAVEWAAVRLADPGYLVGSDDGVPLAAINSGNEEGQRLAAAARMVLENLGRTEATVVTVADSCNNEALLAARRFNGDGVVTAAASDDSAVQAWIADVVATTGGSVDRSGESGVAAADVAGFSGQVADWLAWYDAPLAGDIPAAERGSVMASWMAVRDKIEDYFMRCRLAAFDSRAVTIMNGAEEALTALAPCNLAGREGEIEQLPLAAVTPQALLSLAAGVNPAWQLRIESFRSMVLQPLTGLDDMLPLQAWEALKERLAPCEEWWNARPESRVAGLGEDRLRSWAADGVEAALQSLIEQDEAFRPVYEAMEEVERLTRYCRDLLTVANNFVSFRDFYTRREKAIFQAGTLYLDGRSFELCIQVVDVARHAVLANLSRLYLVYCECVRNGGADKRMIAAAVTDGDADQLLVGRNGVFYDRSGLDWDATIVRLVEHPISIRQAFWDPYKRIGKMVGEGVQKIAAARSRAAEEKAVTGIMQTGQKKEEAKAAAPPFDAGKFAGIFAAVGLAIGAIGTAVASILTGFLKLPWWQMPLALLGIMLLVSGPSIVIAWFKLRQRNLGRLLDANGWAVNARARINIPFGASLTALARLPHGAQQLLSDPYAEKRRPWRTMLVVLIVMLLLFFVWRRAGGIM